jgi:hypothetical protein
MAYDAVRAANYADLHAHIQSQGKCARSVREAIERGGVRVTPTPSAKDMGRSLVQAGFYEVSGSPLKGDIVVIQPAPGHPDGHAAIYNGRNWVSDFRQLHGFYPGPAYRNAQPRYKFYRHD